MIGIRFIAILSIFAGILPDTSAGTNSAVVPRQSTLSQRILDSETMIPRTRWSISVFRPSHIKSNSSPDPLFVNPRIGLEGIVEAHAQRRDLLRWIAVLFGAATSSLAQTTPAPAPADLRRLPVDTLKRVLSQLTERLEKSEPITELESLELTLPEFWRARGFSESDAESIALVMNNQRQRTRREADRAGLQGKPLAPHLYVLFSKIQTRTVIGTVMMLNAPQPQKLQVFMLDLLPVLFEEYDWMGDWQDQLIGSKEAQPRVRRMLSSAFLQPAIQALGRVSTPLTLAVLSLAETMAFGYQPGNDIRDSLSALNRAIGQTPYRLLFKVRQWPYGGTRLWVSFQNIRAAQPHRYRVRDQLIRFWEGKALWALNPIPGQVSDLAIGDWVLGVPDEFVFDNDTLTRYAQGLRDNLRDAEERAPAGFGSLFNPWLPVYRKVIQKSFGGMAAEEISKQLREDVRLTMLVGRFALPLFTANRAYSPFYIWETLTLGRSTLPYLRIMYWVQRLPREPGRNKTPLASDAERVLRDFSEEVRRLIPEDKQRLFRLGSGPMDRAQGAALLSALLELPVSQIQTAAKQLEQKRLGTDYGTPYVPLENSSPAENPLPRRLAAVPILIAA